MHQANRWYLIVGLMVSFVAPLIKCGIWMPYFEKEVLGSTIGVLQSNSGTQITSMEAIYEVNWWYVAIGFYLVVLGLLVLRFIINLALVGYRIYVNDKETFFHATLVLLKQDTEPFSFLKYIFLNKRKHLQNQLGPEIYDHELVHVRHFHSLDIILVEFLRSIFWFNPLMHYYKKAIQLNHEFIADEAVIRKHQNVKAYQQLILEQTAAQGSYLTSNLNYFITKKRLKMMSKKTSRSKVNLYLSVMLPFFLGLLMLFGQSSIAQQTSSDSKENQQLIETYFKQAVFAFQKDGQTHLKRFNSLSVAQKSSLPVPDAKLMPLAARTLVYYNASNNTWDIRADEFAPPPPDAPIPPPPPPAVSPEMDVSSPPAPPAPPVLPREALAPQPPAPPTVVLNPVPPPPPAPPRASEIPVAPAPPAPPPPPPPLSVDELLEMDAEFYLDNQKINKTEAKQLLKVSKSDYKIELRVTNPGKATIHLKKKDK
jgi:hypothetical protein